MAAKITDSLIEMLLHIHYNLNYGLFFQLHLTKKQNTMTTNQLLKADLLDIIFENRNKEYGAYVLRREYSQNLKKALVSMLLLVAGIVIYVYTQSAWDSEKNKGKVYVTKNIELSKVDKPDEPKQQEEQRMVKDKPATKIDNVPMIVDKDSITNPVPDRDTPEEYVPGNENSEATGNGGNMVKADGGGKTNFQPQMTEPETPAVIDQDMADVQPEFPGGVEAWRKYLGNMLRMPEELDAGDKRTVKIKFVVNVNGEITDAVIVQSAGIVFDREVLRVIGKMPKWKPGKQHGKNVAVYFTQPVTFMAEEE